jgi:hypothetical protein
MEKLVTLVFLLSAVLATFSANNISVSNLILTCKNMTSHKGNLFLPVEQQ